jgi:hypothetical protein
MSDPWLELMEAHQKVEALGQLRFAVCLGSRSPYRAVGGAMATTVVTCPATVIVAQRKTQRHDQLVNQD